MKKASFHIRLGFARKIGILLVFVLLSHTDHAQNRFDTLNYREVDSFVLSIRYENDYMKLARDLTSRFPDDIYKIRAIFKWITNNISFDYRFVNSGKEIQLPECAEKYDCTEILRSWENDYIKKVLRNKRAVADGYARLFQKLCEIVHIQCEIIPGYLRSKPYQIGSKISANHTWNAVLVDTTWYFLDVTLASGYCVENEETDKLIKFTKDFQNYYWLTPFARMARNHYPKNGYWGEQNNLSLSTFFNKPHYYSIDVLDNIYNEQPDSGMLTVKKDDTIHFSFNYRKDIKVIQLNSNNFRNPSLWTTIQVSKYKTKTVRDTWAEKKQVYIPFKKTGKLYTFDYIVKDISLYYLELMIDYKKAMRFKVFVTK